MSTSLLSWIKNEFSGLSFNDKRLVKRFELVANGLGSRSEKNICSAFSAWKDVKATYRFFDNKKVTNEAIMQPHIKSTIQRISNEKTVLLIQDTVFFSYEGKSRKNLDIKSGNYTKGGDDTYGLMLHGQLAISTNGTPLGILGQKFIERKKLQGGARSRATNHRHLPVKEKESQRWIDFIDKTRTYNFNDTKIIHMGDREADIYELYRDCLNWNETFLVRASNNRGINKPSRRSPIKEKIFDFLSSKKAQGIVKIKIQRPPGEGKKYREANLSIIFKTFTISPPADKTENKDGHDLRNLTLTGIMAIERNPPKNKEAIKWVLLTNLEIKNVEEAVEKVQWYSMRWNIELLHKILKSGFSVEKSQIRDGINLKKFITLKFILAWRIFHLSRLQEECMNNSAETVLTEIELKILCRKFKKNIKNFEHPPNVHDVPLWIGRLGGFLGRNSDGMPGYASIWKGWQRLEDMIEDYNDFCG